MAERSCVDLVAIGGDSGGVGVDSQGCFPRVQPIVRGFFTLGLLSRLSAFVVDREWTVVVEPARKVEVVHGLPSWGGDPRFELRFVTRFGLAEDVQDLTVDVFELLTSCGGGCCSVVNWRRVVCVEPVL
eukprot:2629758-Amphidinium_carterae.2